MKTIGTIPRDTDNEIRISIGEFQKIDVVDIRWFYRDREGEMKAGIKGLRCNHDEFKHVLSVLKRIEGDENGFGN